MKIEYQLKPRLSRNNWISSRILCTGTASYFFTTASQVALSGPGYASFLRRHPEVKRVALIYFQDPGWGYQYRDAWRTLLYERGVEIIGEYENAEFAPDFKNPLVNILQHKPDAFFVAHDPTTLIPAAKQLRFQGKKALQQQPDSPELAIPTLHYEGVSGVMDFSHSCAGNQSRWYGTLSSSSRVGSL